MKAESTQLEAISQTILDILVSNVPDLVFVKDSHGVYIQCNEAFAGFVGKTRYEIIGMTDYDLFPNDVADFFRHHDDLMLRNGTPKRNEEWVTYPDGHKVLLDTLKIPYTFDETGESGVLGLSRDITAIKQVEDRAQIASQRYESVLKNSQDGFLLASESGEILDVNDAYCTYSGYCRDELLSLSLQQLMPSDNTVKRLLQRVEEEGSHILQSSHKRKDGSIWPVEISISYSDIEEGCFFAFVRDISERKVQEEISSLRFKLSEMIFQDDLHQMLREAVDTAERLTDSEMGFYHFIEEDEENVSIQTWSTRTLKEMCYAKGEGMHYPVSEAGVWVDCIHEKKPVIHNDYESLTHKKGMPEGHPKLIREITVPLFREGRVVSVIGLGNKKTEYTAQDVAIVEQIASLSFEYSERKRTEQQMQFMAYNDLLTKLPNRQLFSDRLSQSISHSKRSGETIAICYLDLDGFKPINDQFGHDMGDQLLIHFAERIKAELREEDTIARIGGDEFALILNGLRGTADAEEAVQRVLSCVSSSSFKVAEQRLHVSVSIGFTCYPQDNSDSDTLLRNADQAMYLAKNAGKNTFYLYTPVKNRLQAEREKSIAELKAAIQENQLILYFQPRVNLQTSELSGVEALVRWQHPERGLLLPDAFLPSIADSPLEIALDEWVVKQALDQHLAWKEQGLTLPVSVNITPNHIQQPTFPEYLSSVLREYPPGISEYLELEVLETSAIGDISEVSDIMCRCIEEGVQFSLDDFGTGYSSLTYFHKLPIHTLKIDQNFVRHMLKSREDQEIVEGVIRLASSINRPVVAEGVENIELGYMLHQLGCDYAQGFGIARPMPASEMPRWALDWKTHSFWQQLGQGPIKSAQNYDIEVAIFTLREWLKGFKNNVLPGSENTQQQKAETECRFIEWYHGIGMSKYSQRAPFPFLLAKHTHIQNVADALRENALERALTESDLAELNHLVEELIDLLGKLKAADAAVPEKLARIQSLRVP